MRERALYAITLSLGAVTAGLIAYAAWRLLPPEAAPRVSISAEREARATERRNEPDLPMKNAEERAQLALVHPSHLGEDVSKRGYDEPRPDGAGQQAVVTASGSPAPIGGPFVAPDAVDIAAPVSERSPVLMSEATVSPVSGSPARERLQPAAPEAQPAAQQASSVPQTPSSEKHAALAEGARPKAQPAAHKAARQLASKKRRSASKAKSRRVPPRKMLGRLPVRVWRGAPPEHLYMDEQMISPGPRIIVVEPD